MEIKCLQVRSENYIPFRDDNAKPKEGMMILFLNKYGERDKVVRVTTVENNSDGSNQYSGRLVCEHSLGDQKPMVHFTDDDDYFRLIPVDTVINASPKPKVTDIQELVIKNYVTMDDRDITDWILEDVSKEQINSCANNKAIIVNTELSRSEAIDSLQKGDSVAVINGSTPSYEFDVIEPPFIKEEIDDKNNQRYFKWPQEIV